VVERARIVLASANGLSGDAICDEVGVSRPTVTAWLDRCESEGVEGFLADRPRSGRPKRISASDEEAMIRKTLETRPRSGTHWSTRLMAKEMGWDATTVSSIWRAHGIKPHRIRTFRLSKDPRFVEKLRARALRESA
jgi:transposase